MRFETINLGVPGSPGPEGPSAYEVAVENGFVGTEEEWLASIEGEQGEQGPTGPQGPMGPPGGAEGYSTKIILMNRMDDTQRALVSSTGPYIDALFATVMGELTNAVGAEIWFPRGTVRFADTVHIKIRVKLSGDSGGMQGSGRGSTIIFDDNRDGFIAHRSDTGPDGVITPSTTNAQGSHFESLTIKPANSPSAAANIKGSGIRMRVPCTIKSCLFDGWAEHGINITATTNPLFSMEYGNADVWLIENCRIGQCRSHGLYIDGNVANAGVATNLDCSNNVGFGIFDSSFLGNTFIACHCANNEGGAFRSDDANNQSSWIGSYSEGDQAGSLLNNTNLVVGGTHGSAIRAYVGGGPIPSLFSDNLSPVSILEQTAGLLQKQLRLNVHSSSALDVILGGNNTGANTGTILDGNGMSFVYLDNTSKELQWRHNLLSSRMPLRLTTYYSDNEDEAALPAGTSWAANALYAVGQRIINGGNSYVCTVTGRSAGSTPAWTPSTAYNVWDQVTNGTFPTRMWRCTVAGTSGTGGGPVFDNLTLPEDDPEAEPRVVEGTVTWVLVLTLTPAWMTGTAYTAGDYVTNDGRVYICDRAGTSGEPPAWAPDTWYTYGARVLNDGHRYMVTKRRGTSTGIPTPDAWVTGTIYDYGDLVTNDGGKIYICDRAGTSGSGPTGVGADIVDGTARWDYWVPGPYEMRPWAASTAYLVGQIVTNDGGKHYTCDTAGTSAASGGPTGTGANITDGTTRWDYTPTLGVTAFKDVLDNTVPLTDLNYAWDATTALADSRYRVGTIRHNRGRTYNCVQAGTAATNARWAAGTAYALGTIRLNDGSNLYECVSAGTSDVSSGPTGTGTGIVDGGAVWDFLYDQTNPPGPTGSGKGIVDGTVVWDTPGVAGDYTISHTQFGIVWEYIPIPGPTGIGADIPDGTGTCRWDFQNSIVPTVTTGPSGTGRDIVDGSAKWDFQSLGPGQMIMSGVWAPNLADSKYHRLNFQQASRRLQQQTIATVSTFTLTPLTSPYQTLYSNTSAGAGMTADRIVTLSAINAVSGTAFKITRTASGAFNLILGLASPTAWVAGTAYTVGVQRLNGGNTYTCTTAGTSADATAWATSTAYALGNLRTNGGNWYKCVVAGTSASSGSGPSGTAKAIPDGASLIWEYVSAVGTLTGPSGTGTGIADGSTVWAYQVTPIKSLAQDTWAEVTFDGNAYYLSAYGSLIT